ncbi:MAG: HRDC domain-containing protein [Pleurocapsa minor GSE-CHR-MK-17-07R]|jgi:ribonuclease D|nr:HRDC domain-containing protein [Pleurocapsa minor GSE-CHR-MK 17-07R]
MKPSSRTDFPRAHYIRSNAQFAAAAEQIARELVHDPLLAVDTEANSMYAYRERVCLIQLSTRSTDYIVDPLSGIDIAPLGEFFADSAIEKVFHAAEYDLICLLRDFGFTFSNLFDTMIAARVCGTKNFGLGPLLNEIFGVEADKSHQRDDWGARPLSAESLLYAQMDTHYLPMLRDHFADLLSQLGRWEDAVEQFAYASQVDLVLREFDPEGYWRLAIPNQLTRRQTAVLRELYLMREEMARDRDVPPFKVIQDKTLVALAQQEPESLADLEQISYGQTRRIGLAVLEAIKRGKVTRIPNPPQPDPPDDPAVVDRYSALREWRKNRALERGVESDVIVPREALWTLALEFPDSVDKMVHIQGLGPWRLNAYGVDILAVLNRFRAGQP